METREAETIPQHTREIRFEVRLYLLCRKSGGASVATKIPTATPRVYRFQWRGLASTRQTFGILLAIETLEFRFRKWEDMDTPSLRRFTWNSWRMRLWRHQRPPRISNKRMKSVPMIPAVSTPADGPCFACECPPGVVPNVPDVGPCSDDVPICVEDGWLRACVMLLN